MNSVRITFEVEAIGELDLILVTRDVADVRHRDDLWETEQRVGRMARPEHIDRSHAGPVRFQRRNKRAKLDERSAARVGEQRSGCTAVRAE